MSKAILYTKEGCPYCPRLIKDLKEQGREYEEINVTYDHDALKKIKEEYNADRVPVLVEGEKVTIGYKGGLG